MIPKGDVPMMDLDMELGQQTGLELPKVGVPPPRRPRPPPVAQDLSRARTNLRNYGRGILRIPPPYRQIGGQEGMPEHIPTLPPRHIADRLLRQYYDHVHHVFPVLHWPTFQDEYTRVYEAGTVECKPRTWGAVLFCVFGCGAIHSLDQDRFEDAKDYLMKSSSMIDVWQDVFHMDQAKAAFFASLVLSEMNLKSASWVWLGSAVRISQDIGLHVETGPWPPIEGEMRKRLWYCIYAQDRYGNVRVVFALCAGVLTFLDYLHLSLESPC